MQREREREEHRRAQGKTLGPAPTSEGPHFSSVGGDPAGLGTLSPEGASQQNCDRLITVFQLEGNRIGGDSRGGKGGRVVAA